MYYLYVCLIDYCYKYIVGWLTHTRHALDCQVGVPQALVRNGGTMTMYAVHMAGCIRWKIRDLHVATGTCTFVG